VAYLLINVYILDIEASAAGLPTLRHWEMIDYSMSTAFFSSIKITEKDGHEDALVCDGYADRKQPLDGIIDGIGPSRCEYQAQGTTSPL